MNEDATIGTLIHLWARRPLVEKSGAKLLYYCAIPLYYSLAATWQLVDGGAKLLDYYTTTLVQLVESGARPL